MLDGHITFDMPDPTVTISAKTAGITEAQASIEALSNTIARMNAGAASFGSTSSLSSFAPPGAPQPGNGLGNYVSGNPGVPGALMPPTPYPGYHYGGPPPMGVAPQVVSSTSPGGIIKVEVVGWSAGGGPFRNGSGGGGNFSGNGSNYTGGGGSGMLPGEVPGQGSSWLTPKNIMAAMAIAGAGLQTYYAASQPTFQANLAISSQRLSGTYVSPMDAYAQRLGAANQGELATWHTGIDSGLSVLGGILGGTGGAAAGAAAGGVGAIPGFFLGAAGGGAAGLGIAKGLIDPIVDITLGRNLATQTAEAKANADRDLAYVRYLRATGKPGMADSIMSAYKSGDQTRVDDTNAYLVENTPNLDTFRARMDISNQDIIRQGGSGAVLGMLNNQDVINKINSGMDPNDISSGYSTFVGAMQNANMGNLRSRWQAGGAVSMQKDVLQQFIASGDMNSIQQLNKAGLIDNATMDRALDSAFKTKQIQSGSERAGYGLSSLQSRVQSMSVAGSFEGAIGLVRSEVDPLNSQIEAAAQMRDRQANPHDRAMYQAQIDSLKASRSQVGVTAASMEYQQRQSWIGLTSASVQAGITKAGLYGSPEDIYGAQMKQVGVYQSSISANQDLIKALEKNGANPNNPAILDLQAKNIELMRQDNQLHTESARALAQMNLSIAATRLSITQMGNAIQMQYTANTQGSNQGAAQSNFSDAQKKYADAQKNLAVIMADPRQSKDAAAVAAAQQQVTGAYGDLLGSASYGLSEPAPLALRSKGAELDLMQNFASANSTTWGLGRNVAIQQYGNIKDQISYYQGAMKRSAANFDTMVGTADSEGHVITKEDVAGMKQANEYKYNTQDIYPLQEKAVGLVSTLQQGSMDILENSMIGGSERATMVKSLFNNRTTASIAQGIMLPGTNIPMMGGYGFTGAKTGQDARTYWLNPGYNTKQSMYGSINSPEGMTQTAAAMAGPGTASHTLLPPPSQQSQTIVVQLKWPNGKDAGSFTINPAKSNAGPAAAAAAGAHTLAKAPPRAPN